MSTVLIPLDETAFAESILPDAEQLAGPGGRLVVVSVLAHLPPGIDQMDDKSDVETYLTNEAETLSARGFQVETRVQVGGDIPRAIDEAVTELGAEMVAVATHGTGFRGWLPRTSVAWKTLAHSPVPVLVRHAREGQAGDLGESRSSAIKVMVPLDGSERAERALPLAAALAARWQGSLLLVQVASESIGGYAEENEVAANLMLPVVNVESMRSGGSATGGQEYLDQLARDQAVSVQTALVHGRAGKALATFARDHAITHVVMTSHGRTGLSRVIVGDVAAGLIEHLSVPIIVIPSLFEPPQEAQRRPASGIGRSPEHQTVLS